MIRRILPVLRFPGVSDIVEFADGKVKLFGMTVDRSSWVAGKTMEELDRAGPNPLELDPLSIVLELDDDLRRELGRFTVPPDEGMRIQ